MPSFFPVVFISFGFHSTHIGIHRGDGFFLCVFSKFGLRRKCSAHRARCTRESLMMQFNSVCWFFLANEFKMRHIYVRCSWLLRSIFLWGKKVNALNSDSERFQFELLWRQPNHNFRKSFSRVVNRNAILSEFSGRFSIKIYRMRIRSNSLVLKGDLRPQKHLHHERMPDISEFSQFHSQFFFVNSHFESKHCLLIEQFHFWLIVSFIVTPFSNTIDFNWDTKIETSNGHRQDPKSYCRICCAYYSFSSLNIHWPIGNDCFFFFLHRYHNSSHCSIVVNGNSLFANISKTNGFSANQLELQSSHLFAINKWTINVSGGWKTVFSEPKKKKNKAKN